MEDHEQGREDFATDEEYQLLFAPFGRSFDGSGHEIYPAKLAIGPAITDGFITMWILIQP